MATEQIECGELPGEVVVEKNYDMFFIEDSSGEVIELNKFEARNVANAILKLLGDMADVAACG